MGAQTVCICKTEQAEAPLISCFDHVTLSVCLECQVAKREIKKGVKIDKTRSYISKPILLGNRVIGNFHYYTSYYN